MRREPPDGQQSGVFAQSATTLYWVDLVTLDVQRVGDFDGCGGVLDIAVDASSRIIASTGSGLYTVDPAIAKCTLIATGDYPNSLSFVPRGTLQPDREALVGYTRTSGDYLQIDPSTGAVQRIGRTVKNWGSIGRVAVYGLASWGGMLYGLTRDDRAPQLRLGPFLRRRVAALEVASTMSRTVPVDYLVIGSRSPMLRNAGDARGVVRDDRE